MDKNAIALGLQIGRILAGQRRTRVPVAYLYNGVRLPALPEWDREKFPYTIIDANNADKYILIALSVLPAVASPGISVRWENASVLYYETSGASGEAWAFESSAEGSTGRTNLSGVVWSNTDIKYGDTIKMHGSEPVPVYE